MHNEYPGVITRFLRNDERLILSKETEMPLVIEAKDNTDVHFLQQFLSSHSGKLLADIAHYGAVLLRGFAIASDEDFEKTVLHIEGLKGISDAFMSEEGRIHVGDLKFILHTNAVYKTGGTLYLGGFHSENYYSPDVPAYIGFCCLKPSVLGGETGLVNMEKIYPYLDDALKNKLNQRPFFVSKWLLSEVAQRYQLSEEQIKQQCEQFDLPIIGEGSEQFILMYKPSIFDHPITKKRSLQINLFELTTLNTALRRCFMNDYSGKTWFWHRFVWRLPSLVLKILEYIYMGFSSFFYSPKNALSILLSKFKTFRAAHSKKQLPDFNDTRVESCFNDSDIKKLAQLMRDYYSSCLWQTGDILLVDNRKIMHAGMPGSGERTIRAMICNPLEMSYSPSQSGNINCQERTRETIGFYMNSMNSKKGELNSNEIEI